MTKRNYDEAEVESLVAQGRMAICSATGRSFDWWNVTVVARYADCSVFTCPCCHQQHDDRHSWDGDPQGRMGYRVVSRPAVTTDELGLWIHR